MDVIEAELIGAIFGIIIALAWLISHERTYSMRRRVRIRREMRKLEQRISDLESKGN